MMIDQYLHIERDSHSTYKDLACDPLMSNLTAQLANVVIFYIRYQLRPELTLLHASSARHHSGVIGTMTSWYRLWRAWTVAVGAGWRVRS
jgi:hypothetical protein